MHGPSSGADKSTWSDLPYLTQERVVSDHLDSVDIRALAKACRAMRSMMLSPALQAAWLRKRHGEFAIWEALFHIVDAAQRLSVVRQLVEVHHADVGVEFDADTSTVLHWACFHGHVDLVSYLITCPNIQINAVSSEKQISPLLIACQVGHVEVVHQLLSRPGIQVNSRPISAHNCGRTPLHTVCMPRGPGGVCRIDLVRQLLSHKDIQVNLFDEGGRTSLHLACYAGQADVLHHLLSHKDIQVNLGDKERLVTALHMACQEGHVDVVRQLLSRTDIKVNLAAQGGWIPLHIACQVGHVDVVRQLLSHKDIQVNIGTVQGRYTPLHLACQFDHVDVVRQLLSRTDIEVDLSDSSGRNAIMVALSCGHFAVFSLLSSHR